MMPRVMMPSAQCSIEPNVDAVEGDLLLRIAPVPHRLVVPRVAEGIDVGRGDVRGKMP